MKSLGSILNYLTGGAPAPPQHDYRQPGETHDEAHDNDDDDDDTEVARLSYSSLSPAQQSHWRRQSLTLSASSSAVAADAIGARSRLMAEHGRLLPALPPNGASADEQLDRLSGSVNIEDLIDEYDEPSSRYDAAPQQQNRPQRASRTRQHQQQHNQQQQHHHQQQQQRQLPTASGANNGSRKHPTAPRSSLLSLSNLVTSSQSYQTARDQSNNDETISFYSALHDGFSLDEYEWRDRYGQDFFWQQSRGPTAASRNGERDSMLQATDFQVFWCDLSYTIGKPVTSRINSAWSDLKQFFYSAGSLERRRSSSADSSSSSSSLDYTGDQDDDTTAGAPSISLANLAQTTGKRRRRRRPLACAPKADPSMHSDAAAVDSQQQQQLQPQTPTINSDNSQVTIIQHLNGSFKSGQLTAIMGPSGAGKTSLLNVLSRRREDGLMGALRVESDNSTDQHKIQISAIPQHDHLCGHLSVRENLVYASRLKNPGANHEKNVYRVSNLLGLDECLETKTRNISGGQQKRVAIAQELLSRPDILILDEPTSGLDSSTCHMTLTVLKDLVRAAAKKIIEPIAIVLTIHQPQSDTFELFDKVYVMANGGVAIYDGPPDQCVDFVARHTSVRIPSPDYNPASFMIDIASGEYGQEPIDQLRRQVKLEFEKQRAEAMLNRQAGEQATAAPRAISHSLSMPDFALAPSGLTSRNGCLFKNATSAAQNHQQQQATFQVDARLVKGSEMNSGSYFHKTRVLTERCWRSMMRDPVNVGTRILFHLLLPFGMSLMLGTEPGQSNACPKYREEYTLMGLVKSSEYISPDVQNEFMLSLENIGVLFITIYSCISANIAAMTLMFTLDMNTCLKEFHNGWYSMSSYLIARVLSNLPLDLTLPTATMALMYVVTGQNTGSSGDMPDVYRIIITALAVILSCICGQIMGMIFGALYMSNVTTALFASQGATLPFVLLSGFVSRTKNMSKWVRVLSLSSSFKHCLDITFIARYGWNVCGCQPDDARGKEPQITGVPDRLIKFVEYWQNSQQALDDQPADSSPVVNQTDPRDLFQMMAKQISLYNTYGIEVKSCAQVVPYDLNDFGLTESDLPHNFTALVALALATFLVLILVVRYVTAYRTSL